MNSPWWLGSWVYVPLLLSAVAVQEIVRASVFVILTIPFGAKEYYRFDCRVLHRNCPT